MGQVEAQFVFGARVDTEELLTIARLYKINRSALQTWSTVMVLRSKGQLRCNDTDTCNLAKLPLEILERIDAYLWRIIRYSSPSPLASWDMQSENYLELAADALLDTQWADTLCDLPVLEVGAQEELAERKGHLRENCQDRNCPESFCTVSADE